MNDKLSDNGKSVTRAVAQQLGLPEKREDLIRKIKQKRTLNDLVEDIFLQMYSNNAEFQRLLAATYDEQALNGSLAFDNCFATKMLHDKAVEMHIDEVASEKLATINKCLGIVLNRYDLSRKQRRTKLGDVVVGDTNGDE